MDSPLCRGGSEHSTSSALAALEPTVKVENVSCCGVELIDVEVLVVMVDANAFGKWDVSAQDTELLAGPRLTTQTEAEFTMVVEVVLSRTKGQIAAMVPVVLVFAIEPDK
jgi:hypothetical protein